MLKSLITLLISVGLCFSQTQQYPATTPNGVLGYSGIPATSQLITTSTGTAGTIKTETLKLMYGYLYPTSDSTSAVQIRKADGSTPVLITDTTNGKISILGTGTLGSESLTEGNFTATTKWTAADDFHLAGAVATVAVVDPGTGYAVGDTITVTQAGGSGLVLTVSAITGAEATGPIDTVNVTAGGASYYAATALPTTAITGTGTTATITISTVTNAEARFVKASGSGTLTQGSGDLAVAGVGGQWYKMVYTMTGASPGDLSCYVTTSFASATTNFILGTASVIYFKSAAAPGDFVLGCSGTSGSITIDNVSVKEVQGGDLLLGNSLTARSVDAAVYKVGAATGADLTLSCGAGEAIKTLTVVKGIVTAATCGSP